MFENVGQKIKGLAKFICGVGIFLSIIIGIWVFYILYNFSNNEFLSFISTIAVIGFGVLISWLSVLVLYGYGDLINNTSDIKIKLYATEKTEAPDKSSANITSQHWICKNCGRQNNAGSTSCWNCKETP